MNRRTAQFYGSSQAQILWTNVQIKLGFFLRRNYVYLLCYQLRIIVRTEKIEYCEQSLNVNIIALVLAAIKVHPYELFK